MKKFKIYFLLLNFFFFIFLYVSKPVYVEKLVNSIEDIKFSVKDIFNFYKKPNPNIVVVAIDEKSVNYFGRWPWDRKIIGDLIKNLKSAKVVGLDIVFSEKTNPESDNYLANAIKEAGNVITGFFFRTEATQTQTEEIIDYLENCSITRYKVLSLDIGLPEFPYVESNIPEILSSSLSCAFFNIEPDADGIYRHYPVAYMFEGMIFPSLAVQLYKFYKNQDIYVEIDSSGIKTAKIGKLSLKDNYVRMNFYKNVKTISAYDVIKGNVDKEYIKDKIVLVGATEMGVFDVRPTPIDPLMPGVYLHYTFLSNLLNNEFLRFFHTYNISFFVLLLFFVYVVSYIRKIKYRFFGYLLLLISPFIVSSYFFIEKNVWLVSAYPFIFSFVYILGIEIYQYFVVEAKSRKIREAFSKYVSPKIVDEIAKNPDKLKLGGVSKEITVLFSDIKDFTSITEKLSPKQVAKLLNIYLEEMTEVILKNDGMVDKYIGDSVMALFNAVIDQQNHPDKACKTALEMIKSLKSINKKLDKEKLPFIDMGIGINTGNAIVGNLGSSFKFEYTAVGDTINLASRLEGLTRVYRVKILVSQFTKEKTTKEFLFRLIDKVKVKGKKEAVIIYHLMDRDENNMKIKTLYEKAIEHYFNKEFKEAMEIFKKLWSKYEDYPSYLLLERCKEFMKNIPENWDGSYEFKAK